MDPLIDREEYAALAYCTYLNQASLGLIPRTSVEASVRFLTEVAQHGNLRLVDALVCRYSSRNGAVTCSFLVGVAGFEPAASSSRTEHSAGQVSWSAPFRHVRRIRAEHNRCV